MKKPGYLPLLILTLLMPSLAMADAIDDIAALFKKADVAAITNRLATSVDVTLLKEENVYSKTQTGVILNKFLTQNKPVSVKVKHRVNTGNAYRFGVFLLVTDKASYRVSFTLNGSGAASQIIDLRIEAEK